MRAFLDQQAPHLLAFRAGLVCHQLHAENLARKLTYFIQRLRHLHAAALAATARVNLRFHHPDFAAQFLGCRNGLLNAEAGFPARGRHAELAQYFLTLVLVYLHDPPFFWKSEIYQTVMECAA